MPKPFANLTGNGLHLHSSLWDAQRRGALRRPGRPPRARPLTDRLPLHRRPDRARASTRRSDLPDGELLQAIGGRRTNSGATWAPAYATYGGNNRTQMLRVPEGGRVENRACDGSANPYLAMAVQLAAGLDGIDRGLDPGEPNRDNLHVLPAEAVAARGIRALPPTCCRRRRTGHRRRPPRGAGQDTDGDYIDYYAQVKRDEFRAWHSGVSDWEVERYLTLF